MQEWISLYKWCLANQVTPSQIRAWISDWQKREGITPVEPAS